MLTDSNLFLAAGGQRLRRNRFTAWGECVLIPVTQDEPSGGGVKISYHIDAGDKQGLE